MRIRPRQIKPCATSAGPDASVSQSLTAAGQDDGGILRPRGKRTGATVPSPQVHQRALDQGLSDELCRATTRPLGQQDHGTRQITELDLVECEFLGPRQGRPATLFVPLEMTEERFGVAPATSDLSGQEVGLGVTRLLSQVSCEMLGRRDEVPPGDRRTSGLEERARTAPVPDIEHPAQQTAQQAQECDRDESELKALGAGHSRILGKQT